MAARKKAVTLAVKSRIANRRKRQDRLLRPRFDQHEDGDEKQAQRDETADVQIGPFTELLVGEADEQRHEGGRQDRRAQVVDMAVHLRGDPRGQRAPDDDQHDQADGHVDQEDPVPAEVVGDQAAEGRPDQGRHAEDGPEEALVAAALGRREDVADDRQRHREEGAGAQSLDAAEQDELPHLLRQAAEHRTDQEDAHPNGEDDPPAEDVGQLPVDRAADRGRQQVRGERPHVDVVALQLADDHRQGGAHDRLVERRQEDSQQDGDQDLDALPMRQLDGCDVVVDWGLRLFGGRRGGGHGRSDLQ